MLPSAFVLVIGYVESMLPALEASRIPSQGRTTTPPGVLHRHVGTALHEPWVLLALAIGIACWRRLPALDTLFPAAVLTTASAGSNRDSFPRDALRAFPPSSGDALVLAEAQLEEAVVTHLSTALAGRALLSIAAP